MKVKGNAFKYGDNVDTDVIIPARYLNSSKAEELAAHCMEDIDKNFVNEVKKGDILAANKNFGCGSSREHAPMAIKAAGISCVMPEILKKAMRWKWILITVLSVIFPKRRNIQFSRSLNLCRELLRQKV